MLAFIDESGDPGMAVDRGSSPFFTIAVVLFDSVEAAQDCQQRVEALRSELRMRPTAEFHFRSDSHERRLALLAAIAPARFTVSAFSLNKTAPRLRAPGYQFRDSLYKNVCKMALENVADLLDGSRVVIDGSGDREFKRALATYLKRTFNSDSGKAVSSVVTQRSVSDPLLQVADYAAGVANRACTRKPGWDVYLPRLNRKYRERRIWP